MSQDEEPKSQRRTGSKPPESVDEKSVMLSLAGCERPALKLRDLEDETPLPELHAGTERYDILGTLGEGGMGKVHLAYDQDLKRRVALKIVRTEDRAQARRFFEEAQVLAQLDHPNIVPLFDIGMTDRGRPYYTMRVVRGKTLRQVIHLLAEGDAETREVYSIARRMQILMQVGQALAYAHERGVIRRGSGDGLGPEQGNP